VMTWIGACVVAAFLIGALIGSVFSRQREDAERDQSHADKLDYPADTNHETSIAALARAQIALAKDANAADKRQSSYNKRSRRISFWTAIGVGTYTVFTAVIVTFNVIQYGETHRFNKKQAGFFGDQIGVMRGQLDEMKIDTRAWVSADFEIPSGFIFDPINPAIELTFHYKNTGKSPAMGVNGLFDAIPIFDGTDAAVSKLKAVCNNVSSSVLGFPLFPGDQVQGNQLAAVLAHPALHSILNPIVLTCIGYRPVGDEEPHFIGRSLQLSMKAPRPGEGCCGIRVANGPVNGSDLKLEIWRMRGGNFAN
jgi:hypothetical protein